MAEECIINPVRSIAYGVIGGLILKLLIYTAKLLFNRYRPTENAREYEPIVIYLGVGLFLGILYLTNSYPPVFAVIIYCCLFIPFFR